MLEQGVPLVTVCSSSGFKHAHVAFILRPQCDKHCPDGQRDSNGRMLHVNIVYASQGGPVGIGP